MQTLLISDKVDEILRSQTFSIEAIQWNQLEDIATIRDFDTIILDLVNCPNEGNGAWPAIFYKLSPNNIRDVIKNLGNIVLFGDAKREFMHDEEADHENGEGYRSLTEHWGIYVAWDVCDGKRFREIDPLCKFSTYLNTIRSYTQTVDRIDLDYEQIFKPTFYGNDWISWSAHRINLLNAYFGKSVAVHLDFMVSETSNSKDAEEAGSVYILPCGEKSSVESLRIIIGELIENRPSVQSSEEPAWVGEMVVFGQAEIESEIVNQYKELERIQSQLDLNIALKRSLRSPLYLLYSDDKQLERAVWSAFENLGGHIQESDDPTKEDGWLTYHQPEGLEMKFVLEIKGTNKETFGIKGIRQAGEWKLRGINAHGEVYKPVFVGNNSNGRPVDIRPSPYTPDFVKTAMMHEAVVIRAEDLYRCVEAVRKNDFDVEKFWSLLHSTNGPIEFDQIVSKNC